MLAHIFSYSPSTFRKWVLTISSDRSVKFSEKIPFNDDKWDCQNATEKFWDCIWFVEKIRPPQTEIKPYKWYE